LAKSLIARHSSLPAQRIATLSATQFIRSSYLFYFSQPAADRPLYKALYGKPIRSVVELGVGKGERTKRLLELLSWSAAGQPIRYTGVDLFEARTDKAGLALKQAFGVLKQEGVKMQLVPGDPLAALGRTANMLSGTDLLIISADQEPHALARAWKYVPRMLHPDSLVYQQEGDLASGKWTYKTVMRLEVERLASAANRTQHRRAA
jgi:hypothetical protein